MGVLNDNPSLAAIINALDDRLRALEQSKRFTVPTIATTPNNPLVGDEYYNTVTNQRLMWDGTQWRVVMPGPGWTNYAATWTAGSSVTLAAGSVSKYMTFGSLVLCVFQLSAASTASAGAWLISLPTAAQEQNAIGSFTFVKANGTTWNSAISPTVSSNNLLLFSNNTQQFIGTAVAANDFVWGTVLYFAG